MLCHSIVSLTTVLFILHKCLQTEATPVKRNPFKDIKNYNLKSLTIKSQSKIDAETSLIEDNEILISIVIKSQAFALPIFLTQLESLKCPNLKAKCNLFVVFDNCLDNSKDLFIDWLTYSRLLFNTIAMVDTRNDEKTKEKHPELDELYFSKNLKKRAIRYAIDTNHSYIFFINPNVILTNQDTIEVLLRKRKSITAPLLTSFDLKYSTYSMADAELFESIYKRENIGCFKANELFDCYLLDLNATSLVSNSTSKQYEFDGDDQEISYIADEKGVLMHVCNREIFGYIVPTNENKDIEQASHTFVNTEHLLNGPNRTYNKPIQISDFIDEQFLVKPKTKLGFDKIYVINLEKRFDRRGRMQATLDLLNIEYEIFKAIDGMKINEDYIKRLGVKLIPKYVDPYSERSLNFGEIGCFLSHYFIWQEAVEKGYKRILILEDDARFVYNFKEIANYLLDQLDTQKVNWELLYFGRKIMAKYLHEEVWQDKISLKNGYGIIKPAYSHWTIAYALTLSGAKKLVQQEPLKKIVPVDEYLPIMFDKQPNAYWSSFFEPRDLITYAIQPQIITPTHYTGQQNHISDTEYTPVLDAKKFELNLDEQQTINEDRVQNHIEL